MASHLRRRSTGNSTWAPTETAGNESIPVSKSRSYPPMTEGFTFSIKVIRIVKKHPS